MTKALTTVSLDVEILEKAREHNINISQAAEEGLRLALNAGSAAEIPKRLSKLERAWLKLSDDEKNRLKVRIGLGDYKITFIQNYIFRYTGIKLNLEESIDFIKKLIVPILNGV